MTPVLCTMKLVFFLSFYLQLFFQVDKQDKGRAVIDIKEKGGIHMAVNRKKRPEITCFYREDGEELQKILKQSFRTVILKQLQDRETSGKE